NEPPNIDHDQADGECVKGRQAHFTCNTKSDGGIGENPARRCAHGMAGTEMRARVAEFKQELRKLGWSESENLRIDERWPADDMDRVRAHATELIGQQPDAILVAGRRTLGVLQEQTRAIPVVFAGITDLVQQGVVTNLARPNGNITGFSNFELSVFGKM